MKQVLTLLSLWLCVSCGHAQVANSPSKVGNDFSHGLSKDPGFFPIAVWLQDPSNAAKYKAAGINVYVGLWQGPTEEQLNALKSASMPVICEQNEVGLKHIDDATIVAWMHGDEPDNAQPKEGGGYGPCIPPAKIVAQYEGLRKKDPSRPVMLNLGQGVTNDGWIGRGEGADIKDYETYVKGADIVSFDVYPVAGIDKDGDNLLWYIPRGLDRLKKWTNGGKRLWNCIECTRIDSGRRPSTGQVRAEVWMSLIHGSTGLIYFVHEWKPNFNEHALLDDPEMLPAVTAINRQIHDLAPALNAPTMAGGVTVTSGNANVPVDAIVKQAGGATYVFSVGMRNAPTSATFKLKAGISASRAEVIGENRTVDVTGGVFKDQFAAYGVHLYRLK